MLKMGCFLGLIGFVAGNANAFVHTEIKGSMRTIDVSIEALSQKTVVIKKKKYIQYAFVGVGDAAGIHYKVGSPNLPVLRFVTWAKPASVVLDQVGRSDATLSEDVLPVLASVPKFPGAEPQVVIDHEAYEGAMDRALPFYSVQKMGSVRGRAQYLVTVYPLRLKKAGTELYQHVRISVRDANEVADMRPETIALVVGKKFAASAALGQFVDFKKSAGFDVERIDVTSTDSAEKIRSALRSVYRAKNLAAVIIVGDYEDVTSHQSKNIGGVTDHYYACLDVDDYESDIGTADVMVGRFSASSEKTLQNMVDKSMSYADPTRHHWKEMASFLASDDPSYWKVAEGTHNYVVALTDPSGYFGDFPAADQKGGDLLYAVTHKAKTTQVMKALNAGRAIVNYSGHGSQTYWVAPSVHQSDVKALTNDALPFVISNACYTGDFREPESFAETWERHANGAILYWGSMDPTYWDEDDILERRAFDGVFKNGLRRFGNITKYAQDEVWKQYGGAGNSKYYAETYHLFGDPSLELRLAAY
jgi:hypothetical protein